ncbi:11164_t:CDS:2 [Gigaspora margarita]|uniref:11164_t:CDS:1 n=1 Tax=Gigaspora margarita TaxID=4874 RepID=A0ABN7UZW8_GIGMA|nr:11164_t:CDS:2 [Gigaspora margarita]
MKKVHNTRSNGKETITALQQTIHPETCAKISVSLGTASPSTTGSMSSNWLKIMEGEAAAENLQKELEVDNTPAKNSMGFDMEGSGNLCDANNLSRQYKEFKELKNKQVTKEETLVPVQNIEAEKTKNISNNSNQEATVQETEVVEQDIQMDDMANLLETEKAHSSIYTERVETSVNIEPSITLSLASNKGNIAPVNLIANNRESAKKVNNTSHN